jgi:hypothetical protein
VARVELKLRGVTPVQAAAATFSLGPLAFLVKEAVERRLGPVALVVSQPALVAAALFVAAMPWLSRAFARAVYRAEVDDLAIYVRSDVLPWKAVRAVHVSQSARRTVVTLEKSERAQLPIVVQDLYAGRLEPLDALTSRLAAHGHASAVARLGNKAG